MAYFHRFLASLFGIINLLAIIPISLISYVMGVGFSYKILGIDLSVSLALGFVVMIVAVGLINGLAAVFLSILDRLDDMKHDREAILEALHHIRQNAYPQRPQQGHHFSDNTMGHQDAAKPASSLSPEPIAESETIPIPTTELKGRTTKRATGKATDKARQRKAPSKTPSKTKAASQALVTKTTVSKTGATKTGATKSGATKTGAKRAKTKA